MIIDRWLRAWAGMFLAVGLFYTASLANADETGQPASGFGLACIGQARVGTAYDYDLNIGAGAFHPSGRPHPSARPLPIRVVVTSVKKLKDGVELWARVDKLKTEHGQERDGLYGLRLVESKGRGKVRATSPLGGVAVIDGYFEDVPSILLGYPDFVAMPEGQSAVVRNGRGSRTAARWTQSTEAKTGKVTVKVDYYQRARQPDVKNGAKILYWVQDKAEIAQTVPMGQEAAPLIQPGVDVPRDDKGMPRHFNVVPVEVEQTEEQVWQPGALFPEKITRTTRNGWLVFQAKLVKVGTGPIEPVAPAQLPPGPKAAPAKGEVKKTN